MVRQAARFLSPWTAEIIQAREPTPYCRRPLSHSSGTDRCSSCRSTYAMPGPPRSSASFCEQEVTDGSLVPPVTSRVADAPLSVRELRREGASAAGREGHDRAPGVCDLIDGGVLHLHWRPGKTTRRAATHVAMEATGRVLISRCGNVPTLPLHATSRCNAGCCAICAQSHARERSRVSQERHGTTRRKDRPTCLKSQHGQHCQHQQTRSPPAFPLTPGTARPDADSASNCSPHRSTVSHTQLAAAVPRSADREREVPRHCGWPHPTSSWASALFGCDHVALRAHPPGHVPIPRAACVLPIALTGPFAWPSSTAR